MSHATIAPQVRQKINEKLRTDADLTAFCIDYFPNVAARFSTGMDRVDKINILLQLEQQESVFYRLLIWNKESKIVPRPISVSHKIVASLIFITAIVLSLRSLNIYMNNENKQILIPLTSKNLDAGLPAPVKTNNKKPLASSPTEQLPQVIDKKRASRERRGKVKSDTSESSKSNIIINNMAPAQINHIGGHHDGLSITQNN